MNKLRGLLLLLFSLANTAIFAAAFQIFPTLAYENSAALNTTGKYTVIFGGTDINVRMKYTGLIANVNGTANSNTNIILPYGRLAYRVDPKWVISFDVSRPALSNIAYPLDSIVSPVATETIIRDTNYSPKFSYQLTDKLAVGLGFDANQIYDAQANFGGPPAGELINRTSGWQYGWDAGLAFQINKSNFLNFSYYSELNFDNLTGYSQLGNLYSPNLSDNIVLPATWTLNLVQLPTPLWTVVETVRYFQWSAYKNFVLNNTAVGNILIPLNYNDSWSAQLATRYQLFEKWGVAIAGEYQSNAQPTEFRPIALPTCAVGLIGASVDYAVTSQWNVKLQYGYVFANPEINTIIPIPQRGQVNIGVNIIDLGVTLKV